ncbi:DUF2254 domain-containing protein [Nonlabens ponticola]|uniref:DUF2254 domain-containing protein n=1 Tax=Nonlabens ponticola TaxID=2496866 RepID=UPI001F4943BC|nr:DUF2254 family protein [Nonlabens ponticola]
MVLIFLPYEAENLPHFLKNLMIQDRENIQFVLMFIIGGIFTLTIFSYTMVMNVMDRSINNFSPRLIPLILSEKHHQLTLGFNCGTIIYAMVLSIPAASEEISRRPPLGATIGIVFSIICILLFIYFIHSVSQSIHINYILKKSFTKSSKGIEGMHKRAEISESKGRPEDLNSWNVKKSDDCGYFQIPDLDALGKIAKKNKCHVWIEPQPGMFVLQEDVLLRTDGDIEKLWSNIRKQVNVSMRVPLEMHETEIKHLVEVAVKASSPAINDPGTALGAIDYLTQLFILRSRIPDHNCYSEDGEHYVYVKWLKTVDLVRYCYVEMWNYMKEDPILVKSLRKSLLRLHQEDIDITDLPFPIFEDVKD